MAICSLSVREGRVQYWVGVGGGIWRLRATGVGVVPAWDEGSATDSNSSACGKGGVGGDGV